MSYGEARLPAERHSPIIIKKQFISNLLFQNGCTNPSGFGFGAAFYFVSFVLIGTMIVLNLFIGVIMNSMDEAKRDARGEADRIQIRAVGLGMKPLNFEDLYIRNLSPPLLDTLTENGMGITSTRYWKKMRI